MTKQSINNLDSLLNLIIDRVDEYYIEQKHICSKEENDGHIIYSKFKKFKGVVTPTLLNQHLQKDINLAIPINSCNSIVFEYAGKYQEAFVSTLSYIFSEINSEKLYITTLDNLKIVVFVALNLNNCEEFTELKKKIEKKLDERLIVDYKILPSLNRPNLSNLLILPREYIRV